MAKFPTEIMGWSNSRSPFTTSRDAGLVVNLYDSGAISLNICEVSAILPWLVLDVSVGGIILGEEIPFTCATRSVSKVRWWDGRHLSLKEGLALVLGLQLIRGIPCHVVTPGVRTSEGGDGKESDKNESQELHCCLRKSD